MYVRNCLAPIMARTSGAGPVAQPIFQPVNEKLLPPELIVRVRSAMPGSVEIGMWSTPKVRCSYTSSLMTTRSCSMASSATAVELVAGQHRAGRVVRGVEQDRRGARRHGRAQLVDRQPEVRGAQRDGRRTAPAICSIATYES